MALVVTAHPLNPSTAVVECSACPSTLLVTGVAPALLRTLVESTEQAHDCAA